MRDQGSKITARSRKTKHTAAIGLALALAAPVLATASMASASEGRPRRANSQRYKERISSLVTGRSGSVTLSARALRGPQSGVTEVVVSTAALDGADPAPGNISHLMVSLLRANHRPAWIDLRKRLSDGGRVRLSYPNLQRGQDLHLLAHVRGVNGPGNHVVGVKARVFLRPDLAVNNLSAPARVVMGAPANITALVREMNGDVGATANCLLLVDGVQKDQAMGIWVDGGSTVSCAFTQAFHSAGSRAIKVQVTGATPAEEDLSNNEQVATIEVASSSTPMTYSASVFGAENLMHHASSGSFSSDSDRQDWGYENRNEGWNESVHMQFSKNGPLGATVRLTIAEASSATDLGVITMAADGWTLPSVGGDGVSGMRWGSLYDPVQGANLYLTSSWSPYGASFQGQYSRFAGEVVYYSKSYSRYWHAEYGESYSYSENSGTQTNGTSLVDRTGASATHRISVRLEDGSTVYVAEPIVPLTRFDSGYEQPLTCTTFDYGGGYVSEQCDEFHSYDRGVSGATAEQAD